jgi:hypothetical protein
MRIINELTAQIKALGGETNLSGDSGLSDQENLSENNSSFFYDEEGELKIGIKILIGVIIVAGIGYFIYSNLPSDSTGDSGGNGSSIRKFLGFGESNTPGVGRGGRRGLGTGIPYGDEMSSHGSRGGPSFTRRSYTSSAEGASGLNPQLPEGGSRTGTKAVHFEDSIGSGGRHSRSFSNTTSGSNNSYGTTATGASSFSSSSTRTSTINDDAVSTPLNSGSSLERHGDEYARARSYLESKPRSKSNSPTAPAVQLSADMTTKYEGSIGSGYESEGTVRGSTSPIKERTSPLGTGSSESPRFYAESVNPLTGRFYAEGSNSPSQKATASGLGP